MEQPLSSKRSWRSLRKGRRHRYRTASASCREAAVSRSKQNTRSVEITEHRQSARPGLLLGFIRVGIDHDAFGANTWYFSFNSEYGHPKRGTDSIRKPIFIERVVKYGNMKGVPIELVDIGLYILDQSSASTICRIRPQTS